MSDWVTAARPASFSNPVLREEKFQISRSEFIFFCSISLMLAVLKVPSHQMSAVDYVSCQFEGTKLWDDWQLIVSDAQDIILLELKRSIIFNHNIGGRTDYSNIMAFDLLWCCHPKGGRDQPKSGEALFEPWTSKDPSFLQTKNHARLAHNVYLTASSPASPSGHKVQNLNSNSIY
jgi:hypothetical protein